MSERQQRDGPRAGRSKVLQCCFEPEGLCCWPLPVGSHELIGAVLDRGGDHMRVRKTERGMSRAESCRGGGDPDIEGNDRDRETIDELSNDLDLGVAKSCGSHQALGEGGRSHREPIAIVQCISEHFPSRVVVDVIAIEEADDDAGVEVDQSHSARKSSTSLVA